MSSEETKNAISSPTWLGSWWGYLLSAVMIVGVVLLLNVAPAEVAPSQYHGWTIQTTSPAWDTSIPGETAEAYLTAYHNSIPKAIAMFDSQTRMVHGFLAKIGVEGDTYYADIAPSAGSGESGRVVRCYFRDVTAFTPLNSASTGKEVRVLGFCTVTYESGVCFTDCSQVYLID